MNLFEVLFIFLFFSSLVTLALIGRLVLTRRREAAARVIRRYALGVGIYLAIVLASSLLSSREKLALAEPLCFDDWCITIRSVEKNEAQEYVVAASLSSRARRAPQRETGVVLYLIDASGIRYDFMPAGGEVPFDLRLLPNETVEVTRTFKLPLGKSPVGVVIAHEGGFPISWFIIGDGPFKAPPIVLLSGE